MKKHNILLGVLIVIALHLSAQNAVEIFAGADEYTPSRSQYFSWINNLNEGATEEQTRINLEFFAWLNKEYGMTLDIYAFDAGAIDGAKFYGSIYSNRFKRQFPNGFDPLYKQAKAMNTRLGVWGGPDGFGDAIEEERARIDQMVKLCKDYEFALFKFDQVCGPLRPEKEDAFIEMMQQCRMYSPDLILLNHRLGLTKSKPYATTFLWEGQETYIDIHNANNSTAPHHRQGALSRGLPPGLTRLTEDHGVCISSCLDNWNDDLVLQAFNRNLILAPQIYGNPWFLKDSEFPKLARIFNIHKKYREVMVAGDAIKLPENQYGIFAVARGNNKTRLLTMRNLSWQPKTYRIDLNESIGLQDFDNQIHVRQFHPTEYVLGNFLYGESTKVTIPPFRSALILVTTEEVDEPTILGCDYEVVKNVKGKPIEVNLLGSPGSTANIQLGQNQEYSYAILDGKKERALWEGQNLKVHFEGRELIKPYHRKVAELSETKVPDDAYSLYETTCFSADNNALEVRSLDRSGKTKIPQVQEAREAFVNQKVFQEKGLWDQFLFDDNSATGFFASKRNNNIVSIKGGCFRLDFGEIVDIDRLVLEVPDNYSLLPLEQEEGFYIETSSDLIHWDTLTVLSSTQIEIPIKKKIRYVRIPVFPSRISEIRGYLNDKLLPRDLWRASNLFAHPNQMEPKHAWKGRFIAEEITDDSFLSVAINGQHGIEGVYAALRVDGEYIGAPDRAVSYPSNVWENNSRISDSNYTYYFPMKKKYEGKNIDIVVLGYTKDKPNLKIEAWQTATDKPFIKKQLILGKLSR
ncbi:hypothetical protein [Aestuariivivens sediminis]|uniref:hypothetical protein n=1 Tax=Aestuariivivens sediminis TaxID=2913557 RepID=UPI001F572C0B|nr:hypothetical protein [Aestuariivivens sediminis]